MDPIYDEDLLYFSNTILQQTQEIRDLLESDEIDSMAIETKLDVIDTYIELIREQIK